MNFSKIGVVGAGMMGAEIALVFAVGGHNVMLHDRDPEIANEALRRIQKILERAKGQPSSNAINSDAAMSRLTIVESLEAFSDRDLVIEAVFENFDVKAETYRRLDSVLLQNCVLASNTSSLSITALSGQLSEQRRAGFLGTHFFSPASRMKLVEVIPGLDTSEVILSRVCSCLSSLGAEPVVVKDVVGFAVNRLLHAFWIEAVRLVEEGVASPQDLDRACKTALGHPIGPFELMDAVSTGLTLDVQEILYSHYGERFLPRPLLKTLVRAGHKGRRFGRGWYRYEKGVRLS